jgi:DNA-binding NarL/FixJ family response regulator
MNGHITLGLVDEHTMVRKTLKYFLDTQVDMRVIFQTAGARDLFEKLETEQPEILLLDPFMHQGGGVETVKKLRSDYPAVKLVLVSLVADAAMIAGLMDMGVHGVISKTDGMNDLLQLIHWVSQGRVLRNKYLTDALNWAKEADKSNKVDGEKWVELDEREKRVLRLIWEEKNNREIAQELFLSAKSIEKITLDMKIKLEVRSTIGLLKYAMRQNIIQINHDNIS